MPPCSMIACRNLLLAVLIGLVGGSLARGQDFKVLVFSKTAGFRHDSIPQGIAAIQQLGAANNFAVDATENSTLFTQANLAQYAAVIFLSTTGDVLNNTQQTVFENYIRSGRGYVGVHAASDTEYGWPWYGGLVGAYFSNHPAIQTATIKVADRHHPSTAPLPKRWQRTDEWYNFATNPRGSVHVLATLDETTYSGGNMGYDHPIMWCHEYDGGRAWYTAGGHTQESFSEPLFRQHLLGGILYAAGRVAYDCGATKESNFQKVVLDPNLAEPMELSVAPDGRVFYIERGGRVKVYKPSTGGVVQAAHLTVTTSNEDGLLGIALDPNFAVNNWLYLFYSPVGASRQHLSRFTMNGDVIDFSSEKVLLHVPTQRDECCHSAGSVAFGPDGNLYVSTGDNTNPFASSGYTPIDERPGRSAWDAQKSSSNRNDLRGKILRITPQADGTYTIPPGNLFPQDGSNGRPEVYVMGCRNPFRMSVDQQTNWLYWGDVGPDAGSFSSSRGPAGLDELNQTRTAGNYGWPYCLGNNSPYNDYNFAIGVSGPLFNCNAPVNDSPNNTGALQLPAARPALIWYSYATSSVFPELGSGGRTICAGPVYHYNPNLVSSRKLPVYYDQTLFIYDWTRKWIKEVKLDDSGNVLKINPFLPGLNQRKPIEMELGPDGALYLLEWGDGSAGNSQLVRIDYVGGGPLSPVAVASGQPASGPVPLTVQFSSAGSQHPVPGTSITYHWDFTSNGIIDSTSPNPSHTYTTAGNYTARLTVRDPQNNTGVANVPVSAGNTAPAVTITAPPDGGFFTWGDSVAYQVDVADAEDGSIQGGGVSCDSVTMQPLLGHDDHAHPLNQIPGCAGLVPTPLSTGHNGADNLYILVEGGYTDRGAPGVSPLTGTVRHMLQPKLKQAEHYTSSGGVIRQGTADPAGGGQDVSNIEHGDHIAFHPMNLANITAVSYRVASAGAGGIIRVRADSLTGPVLSTASIPSTGSWQNYIGVNAPIVNPGGTRTLFFEFLRNPGDTNLFNLNWIDFLGAGVTADGLPGGETVSIDLGSPDLLNRMTHPQVGDGDTTPVTIGGRSCRRNVNPAEDFYFYFGVDDSFAFEGSRPELYITVDFYDSGTGSLSLQYDSSTGTGLPAFYRSGGSVTLTNTNTWRQTTFHVTDAWFGNRQNNGADFRFARLNTVFYIDRVSVTTLASTAQIALAPTDIDRAVKMGAPATFDRFTVTNTGGGTLNYTVHPSTSWMNFLPAAGSSTGEPDTVYLLYNTTGLPTGTYTGSINVIDENALNSPQTINVTFRYLAAGDIDGDGDVDQEDFAIMQRCFSGDAFPYMPGCAAADLDGDGDVDAADFNLLYPCLGGPNLPPGC